VLQCEGDASRAHRILIRLRSVEGEWRMFLFASCFKELEHHVKFYFYIDDLHI
jgi:hypothetical protein